MTPHQGQTWGKPRIIFNSSADSRTVNNMILVLPDGTLVDLFTEYDFVNTAPFFGNFRVMATHSEDRGETWARHSKAFQVTDMLWENCGRPVLGCVANPDTGESIRTTPAVFDAAVDPSSGDLYVVWQDGRFSGFQHHDIALTMSTDGGFTWTAPIRVNQTPAGISVPNRNAFRPSVEVSEDGTVGVTYYDFRFNDGNPGALTDYWFVHCHPGSPGGCADPANWTGEKRLTVSSFDVGQAPPNIGRFLGDDEGLATFGDGFVAAFSQSGGTDAASVFFRRLTAVQEQIDAEEFQSGGPAWVRNATWLSGGATEAGAPPTTCGYDQWLGTWVYCKKNWKCCVCQSVPASYYCVSPNSDCHSCPG